METRFGAINTLPNDRPISEALRLYGEWAQGEIEILSQLLPTSGSIIDGGGHIGVHARAFALSAPGTTVHVFEPHPLLATVLRSNVEDLAGRIIVHECGLGTSAQTGFVETIDETAPTNAGARAVAFTAAAGHTIEVAVNSLDAFDIDKVGFIKLDVEGAEVAALNGATAIIRRDTPVVACEVNTLDAGVDLLFLMRGFGYAPYLLTSRAFNPANYAREVSNIFGYASETSLIFLPPGRQPPQSTEIAIVQSAASVYDFAQAFLAAPRYGDDTGYARNPSALRDKLRSANARLEAIANANREEQNVDEARVHAALLRREMIALKSDLRAQEEELARTRADASASREHRLSAERRLSAAQNEIAALQADLCLRSEDVAKAQKDAVTAREQMSRAEQARASAEAMIDELRRKIDHSDKKIQELEGELTRTRAKGAALVEQIARDSKGHEDLERSLRHEVQLLSSKSAGLEVALLELRERMKTWHDATELLRRTIRELRAEDRKLRAELSDAQTGHGETRAVLASEQNRRSALLAYLQPQSTSKTRRGLVGRLSRSVGGAFADAHREVRQSGYFDEEWYVRTYPDVGKSTFDPLAHFLLVGGFEGLNPSPEFDTAAYLRNYPDVLDAGLNPLVHYLRWGRRELRKPRGAPGPAAGRPADKISSAKFVQHAPSMDFFAGLPAKDRTAKPLVDVIVPVFRGYDETLACLASVLTSKNETPHEVIVIDDCSPEPELSLALRELAALGLITLLANPENLGFVRTANRGMALNAERDVVLLNSDTIVFGNWLDRLRSLAKEPRVASVTPFTNNGTICSYPKFCADNDFPPDARFAAIDELARDLAMGAIEVPTGVGFCMYVTRKSIDEVGTFDEQAFGRGYGEENDFCMRAAARGWRNLQALNTFVFHSGAASFGGASNQGKAKGLAVLYKKHPTYESVVTSHIAADPARGARVALDAARVLGRKPIETILCITHTLGGGIERHIKDRTLSAAANGQDLILLTPSAPGTTRVAMTIEGNEVVANAQDWDIGNDAKMFAATLKALNVRTIELHSTVGWSHRILELVPMVAEAAGASLKIVLHDFTFACPQTTFINESGVYCGELGDDQCASCLAKMTTQPRIIHPDLKPNTKSTIQLWRRAYGRLLSKAATVVTPSQDAADRLSRYFPEIRFSVEPHDENLSHIQYKPRRRSETAPLRIGVIGAIGPHKGSRVLLECARDAKRRGLPMEFVVVGYTNIDAELRALGVEITGRYDEGNVRDRLQRASPDIVFLPSVWPETYCYTLSIALAAKLPIVSFDLGAQRERLKSYKTALLLPISMCDLTNEINDKILAFGKVTTIQVP